MTEVQKEVWIENKLDYGQFILNPKIGEKYGEITKDFALSNLDSTKVKECELRQEIINILNLPDHIQWFGKSFESFMRDQHLILQLHRSKGGFQSRLERSNLSGDMTGTKGMEQEKAKTIFSKQQ